VTRHVLRILASLALLSVLVALADAKTPFGAPGEGITGPPSNGLVAWILAQQSAFYRSMQAIVSASAQGGSLWPLYGLALGYGILHAAGPGHGKAVVSAYIVANERAVSKALLVAFGAAIVQALVAIAAVFVVIMMLGMAGQVRSSAFAAIEVAGYLLIAVLGLMLFVRKARSLRGLVRSDSPPAAVDCDHVHLPGPEVMLKADWRGMSGAMIAAGIRPCTGAIIMLTFCIAQGLYVAGVATVLVMATGTAICTGAIAVASLYAKTFALRFASGRSARGEIIARLLEMLGALVIMLLGVMLAIGFYASGPGSL
jgi:nickel/cobalt transporter (NicO) family protein